MEASMIFNCSRTTAATLPNIFAFWQMLDIRAWQNFMKTARHLLRNPNTMLWRKERNREIASWLGNELWLSIFFVNWKSFASWARGIAIAERDLLCVSTWSLLSTTLNSTQIDFCKRSNKLNNLLACKFMLKLGEQAVIAENSDPASNDTNRWYATSTRFRKNTD